MSRQTDFINEIAPIIQKWQKHFGFGVCSAIIAQACLESAYGSSDKTIYNNYHGLKYKPNRVTCNNGTFKAPSAEQNKDGSYTPIVCDWFAFDSMDLGVEGYFQFIQSGPYKVQGITDPRQYLQALKDKSYATSINYVDNNMRVIETYNLTQYDEVQPMYTNSPLVNYTDITDHNYGPRTHAIDTITIHHMAGNLSVQTCGNLFHKKNGSSNYGINGTDIALYVPESNGAWTSSNKANDMRAVTIEVANDMLAPYWTISAASMTSLINLVADICTRNGITQLVWSENKSDRVGHKNGCNMTLHCDFASTACPGPFLKQCMGNIALAVNAILAGGNPSNFTLNGYDYSPVFDPEYYVAKYSDLQTAFGNNATALWNHFCNFGMNEFRQGSAEFDPVYYSQNNPDVAVAYGEDNPMYYFHYVAFGKAEGRKGAL